MLDPYSAKHPLARGKENEPIGIALVSLVSLPLKKTKQASGDAKGDVKNWCEKDV